MGREITLEDVELAYTEQVIAERYRLIAQGRIDLLVDAAMRMTLDQGEALIAAIEEHWPNHKSEHLDEIKAIFSRSMLSGLNRTSYRG